MLVGGALVNALAFSGTNYLFSTLRDDEERKRHDKALEELQEAQTAWSQRRAERLEWLNDELRRQGHAEQTFQDVDAAMRQYSQMVGPLPPLEKEPTLSDFYVPTPNEKSRELALVTLGVGVCIALALYR